MEPIAVCKTLLKHKFGLRALYLINMTAWRPKPVANCHQ